MNAISLAPVVAEDLADLFSAMSDPNRVRIISELLGNELSVGSLAERLGMTESAVSHQLSGLRQMRLIRGRREGRQIFYSLADDHVEQLFRMGLEHVSQG